MNFNFFKCVFSVSVPFSVFQFILLAFRPAAVCFGSLSLLSSVYLDEYAAVFSEKASDNPTADCLLKVSD